MALATGEIYAHKLTIPESNTLTDDIEAIHVRVREAEVERREKEVTLSKTESRLAKIRGNRKKPARGGGKSQF